MQISHTGCRLLPKQTICRLFWKQQLIVSIILFTIYSKAADELCFVSVEMKGTNLIYYVAEPKGGTDIHGVVRYLDKCVSYASTNLSVHIRVGHDVLFKHIAFLTKVCQKRNLNRVFFYWTDNGKEWSDMSSFSFLYISLFDNASAIRMSPFLSDEVIKSKTGAGDVSRQTEKTLLGTP